MVLNMSCEKIKLKKIAKKKFYFSISLSGACLKIYLLFLVNLTHFV